MASPTRSLNSGQALLETMVVLPVLLLIMIGLVLLANLSLAKLAVEEAAWHGLLFAVTTDAGRERVRDRVNQALKQLAPALPAVAPQDFRFDAGHHWEDPASIRLHLPVTVPAGAARVLGRHQIAFTGSGTCYNRSWIFWNPRDPTSRFPGLIILQREVMAGLRGERVPGSLSTSVWREGV